MCPNVQYFMCSSISAERGLPLKSKVLIVVPNSNPGMQDEKPVMERDEMQYRLNMGITAYIFRQSLLKEIHSAAFGCSH